MDQDLVLHILVGLGPEYDSCVVSFTTQAESFTINDCHVLLLTHEYQFEKAHSIELVTISKCCNQQQYLSYSHLFSTTPTSSLQFFRTNNRGCDHSRERCDSWHHHDNSSFGTCNRPQCYDCQCFEHTLFITIILTKINKLKILWNLLLWLLCLLQELTHHGTLNRLPQKKYPVDLSNFLFILNTWSRENPSW